MKLGDIRTDEPCVTLDSVVAALEDAKSGKYGSLRQCFNGDYEITSEHIVRAYWDFSDKFKLSEALLGPKAYLSKGIREALREHPKHTEAVQYFSSRLAAVPEDAFSSFLETVIQLGATGLITSLSLSSQKGAEVAEQILKHLFWGERERQYQALFASS